MSEDQLIYGLESRQLISFALKVYNTLGYGHQEKYFQRAYEKELIANHIMYEREKAIPLMYNGERIGGYFLDFLVYGRIIIELKVVPQFRVMHVKQVLEYLRAVNCKLALLLYFTRDGVICKRVINPDCKNPF